ncbi:ABC transporter substrate-binding protein [Saccharibacter sp. 17.LH.SD]|nr:ABC transporter substrate-binding protein [Saccharibacter sp. 17.LH.SD]
MASVFLALGACSGGDDSSSHITPTSLSGNNATSPGEQRIGLILPLSGPLARIGARMHDAARLALPSGKMPPMDVFDSGVAGGGATKAASEAIAAGDRLVLGPLTAGETAQVAEILQGQNIPELAFTSDVQQARPGVWVMGVTPEQQVRRLVEAAVAEGRKHFAAFLPDNALGHALGEGLEVACQEANVEPPNVVFHADSAEDISQKMATLSEISTRRPQQDTLSPIDVSYGGEEGPSAINPVSDSSDDAASSSQKKPSTAAANPSVTPPPFDALLLGDTGINLARVITEMKTDQVNSSTVRVLGPMLWRSFDGKLGDLHGAWYVAFGQKQRSGYVRQYQAMYHQAPSPVTDFAYDAAALAGALARQDKLDTENLTRSDGFIGVNGLFKLRTDGRVTRELGIYQILPGGGGQLILPASQMFHPAASVPQKAKEAVSPVASPKVKKSTTPS